LYAVAHIADVDERKLPVTIIGYDREHGLGGPWQLAQGRLPEGPGEVVIDRAFSEHFGIAVGSTVDVLGQPLQVTGLSTGTNSFMAFLVFADGGTVQRLIKSTDRASVLMVQLAANANVAQVRRDLPGEYDVYTPAQFERNALNATREIIGGPLSLLEGVAFLVGLAVIALSTYTSVLRRRQEYGVLRTLGVTGLGLVRVVLTEAMVSAVVGTLVGTVAGALAVKAVGSALPAYPIIVTAGGVSQSVALGLVMGAVGALLPLWRISRDEPAAVFRS